MLKIGLEKVCRGGYRPAFDEDALAYLRLHKNLRITVFDVSLLSDFNDYRFLTAL